MEIYDIGDLGDALKKGDKKQSGKIVTQLVRIASAQLSSRDPFLWSFLELTEGNRYISFETPAPAAVNVTNDGLKQNLNLFLNPQEIYNWFKNYKRPFQSFKAVMIHEMRHLMYAHQARFIALSKLRPQDHELANIAEDAIINEDPEIQRTELQKDIYDLNSLNKKFGTNYDPKNVKSLTWEKIYFELVKIKKQHPEKFNTPSKGDTGQGSVHSKNDSSQRSEGQDLTTAPMAQAPGAINGSKSNGFQRDMESTLVWPSDVPNPQKQVVIDDKTEVLNALGGKINQALSMVGQTPSDLKSRGLLSADLEEALTVRASSHSRLKLTDLYKTGTGRIVRNRVKDSSHYKFNSRRFEFVNKTKRDRGQNIIAYVDTSGSMTNEEIVFALTELVSSVKGSGIPITLKTFDVTVHDKDTKQIRNANQIKSISISGRGGTIAQSVFDDIKKNGYDDQTTMVVIMTDGEIEQHVDNYNFHNVVWTIIGNGREKIPKSFPGVVGYLSDEDKYKYKFLNNESEHYFDLRH